jgi:hypothetical protein
MKLASLPMITLLAGLLAAGCGDDDNATTPDAGDPATPDAGAPAEGPLYAVMYEVYDNVGSISYLSLLGSLDIESVDLSKAREFGGGRAFIQAYGGKLFVGDADAPTVTRYAIGADDQLVEEKTISFANFGLTSGQFDSWNVSFVSAEKAYLLDFKEGTTIIWNPSTMETVGEIAPPANIQRAGLSLEGSPGVVRDGLLFRTFNWVNYDDAAYSTDYLLAIYDVQTDELLETVTETRCPVPGNLVHTDEAGTIYFSNWIWPVAGAIMRDAPSPCVQRIKPGEKRFDAAWVLDYADVTEGREGAMFTYLPGGQALVAAFYEERTEFDAKTDPWAYVGSLNWKIWQLDMGTMQGAPLAGLDFNGGAFTPVQFDDRLLLMVPGGADESWATQVYEVTDGMATPRVKLPGWSYQFVKLR